MRRYLHWLPLVLLVVVALGAAGFVVWAGSPLQPMDEAKAAMQSDDRVTVTTGDWLVFRPADTQPTTGFIFYPGAHVAPEAYAPPAHAIADEGFLVVIVPMPLNFPIFGAERASSVIMSFPDIQHWAVGGHSLGGVMAARYAYDHPDQVEGAILWAAYPDGSNSLFRSGLQVLSIYGTADALTTTDDIVDSLSLLPAEVHLVPIQGGNHSQFGWYGLQPGDSEATISREEQQGLTVAATVGLLSGLGGETSP